MGWMFNGRPLKGETPKQYFARHFTYDGETTCAEVIDAAQASGVVYLAVRKSEKSTGVSYVFCGVILFRTDRRDGFGFKAMDEGMGPCQVNCPGRIMKLLTPVDRMPNPGYAADWRARVEPHATLRRAARKATAQYVPGDLLQTQRMLRFGSVECDRFEVVPTPLRTKGLIFRPVGHDFVCRVRRKDIADGTRIEGPLGDGSRA